MFYKISDFTAFPKGKKKVVKLVMERGNAQYIRKMHIYLFNALKLLCRYISSVYCISVVSLEITTLKYLKYLITCIIISVILS